MQLLKAIKWGQNRLAIDCSTLLRIQQGEVQREAYSENDDFRILSDRAAHFPTKNPVNTPAVIIKDSW